MPFESQAQRRLFYAKERRGELPKGTTARWNKHTGDKKLPERKKEAAMPAGFNLATLQHLLRRAGRGAHKGLQRVGGVAAGAAEGAGYPQLSQWAAAPSAARDVRNRTALLGGGVLGAGALGAYGLSRLFGGSEKESSYQLGTPYMDGFLAACASMKLSTEQMATMLEKGAEADGKLGTECRQFMDRLIAQ